MVAGGRRLVGGEWWEVISGRWLMEGVWSEVIVNPFLPEVKKHGGYLC